MVDTFDDSVEDFTIDSAVDLIPRLDAEVLREVMNTEDDVNQILSLSQRDCIEKIIEKILADGTLSVEEQVARCEMVLAAYDRRIGANEKRVVDLKAAKVRGFLQMLDGIAKVLAVVSFAAGAAVAFYESPAGRRVVDGLAGRLNRMGQMN